MTTSISKLFAPAGVSIHQGLKGLSVGRSRNTENNIAPPLDFKRILSKHIDQAVNIDTQLRHTTGTGSSNTVAINQRYLDLHSRSIHSNQEQ